MKFLLIICAIVYLGAAIPINLQPKKNNTTTSFVSHLSVLSQFRKNPSTFVSQMSKADPTTLRTVLDLLRGLLTTSNDREDHLISTLNGKNDELNSANADVANAQTVLSDAETDRANAQNAVTAAESDLAEKEGIAGVKLTEKNDAQSNHDAEIDSLNEEQTMIQEVITILEDLLGRQNSHDYEQTVGYCRGGDLWDNNAEWDCLESTNGGSRPVMTKAECQRKCDLHSECSAYDRSAGEDAAQCCLFKGSSTGNGNGNGRQCNVKGAKTEAEKRYIIGPKTGCDGGQIQISNPEDCQEAAETLGVRYWGGNGHSSGADPTGCIFRTGGDIYFNTHPTGSLNRNDRKLVCTPE